MVERDQVRAAIAGVLDGADLDAATRARLVDELREVLGKVCDGLAQEVEALEVEPLEFDDASEVLADLQKQGEALLAQLKEPSVCPFCGQPWPGRGTTGHGEAG